MKKHVLTWKSIGNRSVSNTLIPFENVELLGQGIEQTMYSLVQKGLLKPEDTAKELNVTVEEFAEKMRKAGY